MSSGDTRDSRARNDEGYRFIPDNSLINMRLNEDGSALITYRDSITGQATDIRLALEQMQDLGDRLRAARRRTP